MSNSGIWFLYLFERVILPHVKPDQSGLIMTAMYLKHVDSNFFDNW